MPETVCPPKPKMFTFGPFSGHLLTPVLDQQSPVLCRCPGSSLAEGHEGTGRNVRSQGDGNAWKICILG